jgi:hypothetical protein
VTSFRNLANDADFQQISYSGDFSLFLSFGGSKRKEIQASRPERKARLVPAI